MRSTQNGQGKTLKLKKNKSYLPEQNLVDPLDESFIENRLIYGILYVFPGCNIIIITKGTRKEYNSIS